MLFSFVIAFLRGLTSFSTVKAKNNKKSNSEGRNMILPTEVWVMGHRWEIIKVEQDWFDDTDAYGNCCSVKRKIQIFTGGGGSITRDTLLHEILHACWTMLAFNEKEEEERVVNSLSSILIGIMDDPRNINVVRFIAGK
jgi:hypothetical protein